MRKIKDLRKDEFFTLRKIGEPKESQVYVRGEYNRSMRKFECAKFSDICDTRYLPGDREVYTDFTF